MELGYWVILEGSGGVLDRKFAVSEDEMRATAREMTEFLNDGDVIRIVEGESENDEVLK